MRVRALNPPDLRISRTRLRAGACAGITDGCCIGRGASAISASAALRVRRASPASAECVRAQGNGCGHARSVGGSEHSRSCCSGVYGSPEAPRESHLTFFGRRCHTNFATGIVPVEPCSRIFVSSAKDRDDAFSSFWVPCEPSSMALSCAGQSSSRSVSMKSGCCATRSVVGLSAYQTPVFRAYLPGLASTWMSLAWSQSSDHGAFCSAESSGGVAVLGPFSPSDELGMANAHVWQYRRTPWRALLPACDERVGLARHVGRGALGPSGQPREKALSQAQNLRKE